MSLLWWKRASHDWESIGRTEHPNVQHYQSGGIGHREGDESHSVVGFLPRHVLEKYRMHDGMQNPEVEGLDRERIDAIKKDIKSGKGITNPVEIHYDDKRGWASLGEGNHRLAAARESDCKTVPVRVYGRSFEKHTQQAGLGAPLHLKTEWNDGHSRYVPPDIHPDHFDWGHDG